MKSAVALGTATRTVGKMIFALLLLFVAVAVGFGGTALFVYHQFNDARHPAAVQARNVAPDHRADARAARQQSDQSSQTRRVSALTADAPQYTYADNTGGQPTVPGKRTRPAVNVPAPLDPSTLISAAGNATQLNDPESRYITDARTGRVIGIDGSAGAWREEQANPADEVVAAPRAVAVQTPPPEVRVASPVIEDGRPIYHGNPAPSVNVASSQFIPIRKALPVAPDDADSAPRTFDAGEYMADDQNWPVLRAQAVVPPGARVVKTVRIYRFPDGSQTVAAY